MITRLTVERRCLPIYSSVAAGFVTLHVERDYRHAILSAGVVWVLAMDGERWAVPLARVLWLTDPAIPLDPDH